MRSSVVAILVTCAALAGACDEDSQPSPGQGSESKLSEVRVLYNAKCARCHGFDGAGHGIFSDSLHPKPHNYTDPAWQASVTDDQIKEAILRGGLNMGKSPAMPASPLLKKRPEVLDGLVKLIRSFNKRP